jgi:hypothetical protein
LVVPPARALARTAPTLIFKVRRPLIICSHYSLNRSIFPRGPVSLRCHANTPQPFIREHCYRRHLLRPHRWWIPRTFRTSGLWWLCLYSKFVFLASISVEQEGNDLLVLPSPPKQTISNFGQFLIFQPRTTAPAVPSAWAASSPAARWGTSLAHVKIPISPAP